jgi:hypothetical protein
MSKHDALWAQQIDDGLTKFMKSQPLPGIDKATHRKVLVEQFVESIHRVEYVVRIAGRPISAARLNPAMGIYDPIRAAALLRQQGKADEAFWQAFLSVHFGRNLRTGWQLAGDVYGSLGQGRFWDWATTSANPKGFRKWLHSNQTALAQKGGRFGNHRKYVSLDANSGSGTGAAFETYVDWVAQHGDHAGLIQDAKVNAGPDPRLMFDYLYRSMGTVASFGRMGKFDYLTMIGKLKLAAIDPGSVYMVGATGPLQGGRLLLGGRYTTKQVDQLLVKLGSDLGVGMQVIEDAICNWQKSPGKFIAFRG